MTSGVRPEGFVVVRAAVILACLLSAWPVLSASAAVEANLAQVMQGLSQVRSAEGRFTEHRYLSILSEPLVLEGTVSYRAPDYVRKEYDDPGSESYGRRRDLAIDEHPVLRAFVESYRGTLAGDLETLRRYFDLTLSGSMDDWRLRLTPRLPDLAQYLSAVIMQGTGAQVLRVETLESSGDRSVMIIESPGG